MTCFQATTEGIDEATASVETFIRKAEPGWSLPESVRDALLFDLQTLEIGGDINYVRGHESSDG